MKQKGFTMIELLVVITIIGILAVISLPRYIIAKKSADYAVVQAMAGTLNIAGMLQFCQNRILQETGQGEPDIVEFPADLAGLLDPPYTSADYPRWTVDDANSIFIYAHGKNTWSCRFHPETETSRARVELPVY